jgi:hypothetical protein
LNKDRRAARLFGVLAALASLSLLLLAPTSTTAAVDGPWTTYAHDPQRTSVGSDQTAFSAIRLDWFSGVDGAVYAQPLVWSNLVFVATQNNSIYAYDALTGGSPRWQRTLGEPAQQADFGTNDGVPCSNIGPTVGITSTPVIDYTSGLLYVVGVVRKPSIHHELWTFNATTGEPIGSGRTIDPWPAAQALVQQQRPALLLANGYIYVGFGGRVQECGNFSGWLAAIPTNGGPELSWQTPVTLSDVAGSSIWSPGGPSLDLNNNVWVSTGNGDKQTTRIPDLSESVIKFSPSPPLVPQDSFTPSDWVNLNISDLDLGSFTTAHLTNNVAFHIGKAGRGYLLDENHLGHSYPSGTGTLGAELFSGAVCGTTGGSSLVFAAAAWDPPNLYVPCIENIKRLQVTTTGPPTFSIAAHGPANSYTGSTVLAYGAIWNVNPTIVNGAFVSATLNSYDRMTLSLTHQTLISDFSGTRQLPTANFASPAAGYGHIYVATKSQINAYALTFAGQTPTSTPTSTPTRTPTPTRTSTPTPTLTATSVVSASSTPTPTPTATATSASVATSTNTPVPTSTSVPPTNTPVPSSGSGGGSGGGGGGGGGGGSTDPASVAAAAASVPTAPTPTTVAQAPVQVAGVAAPAPAAIPAGGPSASSLPDGSVLTALSPNLTLLQPAETASSVDIAARLMEQPDPSGLPALGNGFRFGGDFFSLTATTRATQESATSFPVPLTLTYRPSASTLQQAGDLDHVRVAFANHPTWLPLPCTAGADGALICTVSHASLFASLIVPTAVAPLDGPVPNGWLYRQANGYGGAGSDGYSVIDDDQAAFWSELQRLGGVDSVGYPITERFQYQGYVTQAFQKIVLQWRPELDSSVPVNVLDELNGHGADAWLDSARQVPPAADTQPDTGLTWEMLVERHTAFLDPYPALRAFYDADPTAFDTYGLPLAVKDYGAFVGVRLQRATLQLWPQPDGGQRVVVGNAADIAKEAGLWPVTALVGDDPQTVPATDSGP